MTEMVYSYDRSIIASTTGRLLGLIVDKVIEDRNPKALIEAYTEEVIDDFEEEEGDHADPGSDRFYRDLGFLKENDAEKVAQKIYVKAYRRVFRDSHPLEGWEWPGYNYDLPNWIHRKIAEAIGLALGGRDGRDAQALLQMHQRSQAGVSPRG